MPKYCPACRVIVNREKTTARNAAVRAELNEQRAQLREILEPMRDYMSDSMIVTADEFLDSLAPDSDVIPLLVDRMPAGTSTPSGPDEGATSEFEDLREELEQRRVAAIMHDWHAEHPGWWLD